MMKSLCAVLLALLLVVVPSWSFTLPTTKGRYSVVVLKSTLDGAQAYLIECLEEWNELEAELDAFRAGPNKGNELAAADLAEKMLHKALDTARAVRDVEEENSFRARQTYTDALEEKLENEAALGRLDGDVLGTTSQVSLVEGLGSGYDDIERVRDLAVAHAAHDQIRYWQTKLSHAEQVAAQAKQEFTKAENKLSVVEKTEKTLKNALGELHVAQNTLRMQQWK